MLARNATDLGAAIRDRRKRLRLDQRTLAARVGVSRQWIIEVEQGKPRAEVGLVLRTLEVLGLSVSLSEAAATKTGSADIDDIVRRARKPKP